MEDEKLTEKYGQMFDIVDENLQSFAIDGFNDVWIRFVQFQNPIQNFILFGQIAGVNRTEFVAVEGECWQLRQIVFLVDAFIGCLDEINVFLFTFIVDIL